MPATKKILSIILPCLNESEALKTLLPALRHHFSEAEIIVVDDGSTPPIESKDEVTVLRHPKTKGNGAAIKTGARAAKGDVLLFLDADGQHDPKEAPKLIKKLEEGYDMVVGARSMGSQASLGRWFANSFYNKLASWMTGYQIEDLTSGFRALRAKPFRNFLYLLPNGFSYPTTSTMAFFRCGYSVAYVPIKASQREGKSKIRLLHDGFRFYLIILKIGALFSPMRFFLPISLFLFLLATAYYGYTYINYGRFTNMSALLYMSAMFSFLFGILSEQISSLHYRNSEERRRIDD